MRRATIAVRLASSALLLSMSIADAQTTLPVHGNVVDQADFTDDLSIERRANIERDIQRNLQMLRARGIVSDVAASPSSDTASLQWPLQATAAFAGFDYHGVSNFVDHDPKFPGFVQDYTCGSRSYDNAAGYNHAGTDYFLWPYPWLMMDTEQVAIVAAAPGTIVAKSDGNFDRSCAMSATADWNAVYIRHADGSVAWYGHMKSATQTTKPIGASVSVGEFLGFVGSSGSSTGPHMHFELHDAAGNILDPRHGTCNAGIERWAVFQPYEQPTINSLSTHGVEPAFVDCGMDANGGAVHESPSYQDTFMPGDVLWIFASYHDQRSGENTHFRILHPDGSVFVEWDFDLKDANEPSPFYAGAGWDWQYALPGNAPAGNWTVQATFQGTVSQHAFTVSAAIPTFDTAAASDARKNVGAHAARCRPGFGPQASGCSP